MTNLSSLKKKYLRIYTDKFRGRFLVFVITVDIFFSAILRLPDLLLEESLDTYNKLASEISSHG
jgi:hypothetical protein